MAKIAMRPRIEIIVEPPGLRVALKPARELVCRVAEEETLPLEALNIILTDDRRLQDLHCDYLHDDTPTDVITFNLSEAGRPGVEGEIYISVERARTQAAEFKVTPEAEIARLIIHGMLHLKGYDDHTIPAQRKMREREEHYLQRYGKLLRFLPVRGKIL